MLELVLHSVKPGKIFLLSHHYKKLICLFYDLSLAQVLYLLWHLSQNLKGQFLPKSKKVFFL